MNEITLFEVKNLHGYKSYRITIEENRIILVGENGSGKTTVLRLLYYLLAGEWEKLHQYNFDSLGLTIDTNEFQIMGDTIHKSFREINPDVLAKLPLAVRRRVSESITDYGGIDVNELEMMCRRYGIDYRAVMEEISESRLGNRKTLKSLEDTRYRIRSLLPQTLLYLPTYRRIEQELSSILRGSYNPEVRQRIGLNAKFKNSIELVEFGMSDVVRTLERTKNSLLEYSQRGLNDLTLRYLGEVVDEDYKDFDVRIIKQTSTKIIEEALDRMQETILTKDQKKHIMDLINSIDSEDDLSVHNKVICHYLKKLLGFLESLSAEESKICRFIEVCNSYLVDKQFVYDLKDFSITIQGKSESGSTDDIELRYLSSGEKQVVSLMCQLYLSRNNTEYFVLIDEPELSLSVPWQRRFLLDIINGGYCSGLVAVTHSPFIFDNELKKYARGLGEFIIKR